MNEFKRLTACDKERVLEISKDIWEGDDYIGKIFDEWLKAGEFCGLFVDGLLVGFSRFIPFDNNRGWLHGLRVAQSEQGKGYGRIITKEIIRVARNAGMKELFFSTYFGNEASIKLNESLGFKKIVEYTNMEYEIKPGDTTGMVPANDNNIEFEKESWESWLRLPAGYKNTTAFLKNPYSFEVEGTKIRLADNHEYENGIDIATIEVTGELSSKAIEGAISIAAIKGKKILHIMVPPGLCIEPFKALGFHYWERPDDVLVYHAKIDNLKI